MKLILGDAPTIMKGMDPQSIDCVITDPPYAAISGGNANPEAPSGMLDKNDGKNFKHNDVRFRDYLRDLYRIMRDPSHLYLMVNFLNLDDALRQLKIAGFKIHNLLVWKKQNATPNRWYMKNCEYVIFARRGAAFSINNKGSKTVHEFINPTGDKLHPTEKPVDLMKYYILNSTQSGETVLDPFMGSGSTGVAAQETGRHFTGIEIDPEHMATACKRMNTLPGAI